MAFRDIMTIEREESDRGRNSGDRRASDYIVNIMKGEWNFRPAGHRVMIE
jgi:hypothetical protein